MSLFDFIKNDVSANWGTGDAATEEELVQAGYAPDDDDYTECPRCCGPMEPTMGDWWSCVRCGFEAKEDDYGNLVF